MEFEGVLETYSDAESVSALSSPSQVGMGSEGFHNTIKLRSALLLFYAYPRAPRRHFIFDESPLFL
jgi:hypothetical protein